MPSTNDDSSVSSATKEHDHPAQVDLTIKQSQEKTVAIRLKEHLTSHVRVNILAETELLILTFCTGMQDATTFPDYHCFASNQTGNTVMLAMAILLPDLTGKLFKTENIGVGLGFFLAAGWITGQLGHVVGPRSRIWIVFCNLIQSILVFMAAAIQYAYGIELEGTKTMVVIGLLAFAAGSQVVLSRALAITEISTAMATAAWVDLLIDPHLFAAKNRPRNRRVSFLAALVAGAFFGAGIYRGIGPATSVLFSAIGKLIVTLMFLFNKAEKAQESRSIV
ncbi:uncharacterized protein Z519_09112 [Cladophialophora bantiana CBS 173.52]|uniref:DUF1275 domain protein n=1 Tax=Cladophialophora bantiana (strain ATCC 10958 / CBS 173.52 / CDC B-1940 / NIH 8579) TaxID=1442370 RepID=A0A0D2EKG1_CLAB1|nr:uncharacterized protein Z519_09112 [Cladophialophora bantiana CBS 173.52]KIW90466.1 hypothetical protein Z519_09112 [Cladophialophora bantiana CBS 173.52]